MGIAELKGDGLVSHLRSGVIWRRRVVVLTTNTSRAELGWLSVNCIRGEDRAALLIRRFILDYLVLCRRWLQELQALLPTAVVCVHVKVEVREGKELDQAFLKRLAGVFWVTAASSVPDGNYLAAFQESKDEGRLVRCVVQNVHSGPGTHVDLAEFFSLAYAVERHAIVCAVAPRAVCHLDLQVDQHFFRTASIYRRVDISGGSKRADVLVVQDRLRPIEPWRPIIVRDV